MIIGRTVSNTALNEPQYYRLLKNQNGAFDGTFGSLTGKPTTLVGYGITDAQPLHANLTAISALTTTAYGLALLTKTDAADVRSYIGAGSSSFSGAFADLSGIPTTVAGYGLTTDFNTQGDARWQAKDADLDSWAAITPGSGWAAFLAATKPTTIAGYGITDFNSLGDARWQALDADLTAIAALTTNAVGRDLLTLNIPIADSYLLTSQTTGAHSYRAFNQVRSDLGLVIGTNVQAFDATLTALAALTIAANSLTVGTGADAFSQTTFAANTFPARASTGNLVAKTLTDFALTLLDDADAATVRATIGAGTGGGTVTSFSAGDLSPLFTTSEATATTTPALTFALSTTAANTFFGNGTGSTAAPTFMTASDARTALGLVIGTNVQAYDADLTAWAAITPGSGWSTLLAATKPTTIAGYGITDFNSLGDARWQATDADLTAIAAITGTHEIYYRSAANTWSPVLMGPGIFFRGPYLTTMSTSTPAKLTADQTTPSAATLDLTGLDGPVIDVTGTTNITSITGLPDGEYRMLRFPDAPLTLVQDSGVLELLGGVDQPVTANGLIVIAGGTAGLVTVTEAKDANNYSKHTFDNIYMNGEANIGYSDISSGQFDVGAPNPGTSSGGTYLHFESSVPLQIRSQIFPDTQRAELNVASLTSARSFSFPDRDGYFALVDGIGLKLGSLTTNGFVKTSGSDGTLSVDTSTFLTANQTITLSGDISGTGTTAITTAIGAGKVTLAMMANMATASLVYRKTAGSGAPEINTLATLKTDLGLSGTNSGDQTVPTVGATANAIQKADGSGNVIDSYISDTGDVFGAGVITIGVSPTKIVVDGPSAQLQIESTDIASPGLLFVDQADHGRLYSYLLDDDTSLAGDSSTAIPTQHAAKTYTDIQLAALASFAATNTDLMLLAGLYKTLLTSSGSITAAQTTGVYGIGMGDALIKTGSNSIVPLNTIYIASADYPSVGGIAPKLRIRVQFYTNDVAPLSTFTFALYPVARPGTSGGAGVCIYTISGAVSGSNGAVFTAPAADGLLNAVSSDFSLPSDGHYVIGVSVSVFNVAASAHVHCTAQLQIHTA